MYARTIKSNKPPPSNQNSKKPKQHEYINKNSKKIREQKIREQWIKIRKTKKITCCSCRNWKKIREQKIREQWIKIRKTKTITCCSCRNWKKRKTEIKSRGRLLSASPS
jgi:hypothetical protein